MPVPETAIWAADQPPPPTLPGISCNHSLEASPPCYSSTSQQREQSRRYIDDDEAPEDSRSRSRSGSEKIEAVRSMEETNGGQKKDILERERETSATYAIEEFFAHCSGKTYVDEISDVESLEYDFITIQNVTNNLSEVNKIGEGDFNMVYKVNLAFTLIWLLT
nr:Cysteine-rich receptor-like protein kinase 10 [Ipomoea batatas]